jgi:tRNA A-37 threonylcarbamoyl transferase component Bud32
MRFGNTLRRESRGRELKVAHRPDLKIESVAQAIARHRENAAKRWDACEHWGPGASVSRVVLETRGGPLDLAVKWNHWRGWRAAIREALRGSRAARAARGADWLREIGLGHPESLAVAERRRFGLVSESFLITRFITGAEPLPAAIPALRASPARRRGLAYALGELIGTLHARGLDHSDLKHSNLLLTPHDSWVLLDLDALASARKLAWRRRVRALGQLEAYATDLYPWLPRSDRLRFLRAYLGHNPELSSRRRELVDAVSKWVARRLETWAKKDRSDRMRYPLAPRGDSGTESR